MESHPRSEPFCLLAVCLTLKRSLASGWRANQHRVPWTLLIVPAIYRYGVRNAIPTSPPSLALKYHRYPSLLLI
jgi:hypothetical protein